ncbi:MAG: hypothetical protein IKG03_02795 [Clostridiales bacterium]|nr:hypothetical protein [Clostridiales bacterium]
MHRFCGKCGSPLGPEGHCLKCGWTPPSQAENGPAVKHRFCGKCGQPLGTDSRCAHCGWIPPAANSPAANTAFGTTQTAALQTSNALKKASKKQASKAASGSKSRKKTTVLLIVIPVAVILTGLIVVLVLNFTGVIHLFGRGTVETLKRPSAEEYLSEIGQVSGKEPADNFDLYSEAEAFKEFSSRGFTEVEIVTYYNTDGEHIGTVQISAGSNEKHPCYEALYRTPSGVVWTVILTGDSFYAEPLTYKANGTWATPHTVSESDSYWVYDGEANAFFTVEPDDNSLKIKTVGRIDAGTLNGLDAGGVDEL